MYNCLNLILQSTLAQSMSQGKNKGLKSGISTKWQTIIIS